MEEVGITAGFEDPRLWRGWAWVGFGALGRRCSARTASAPRSLAAKTVAQFARLLVKYADDGTAFREQAALEPDGDGETPGVDAV